MLVTLVVLGLAIPVSLEENHPMEAVSRMVGAESEEPVPLSHLTEVVTQRWMAKVVGVPTSQAAPPL